MNGFISDQQWARYEQDGYLKLGTLLSDAELSALQNRTDEIMLGKADVDYERMLMQLDSETGLASRCLPVLVRAAEFCCSTERAGLNISAHFLQS